jgi:hypothetical protein
VIPFPQSLPYLSGEGSGFSDRSPPMAFPARSNALPDSFFGAFLGSSGRFQGAGTLERRIAFRLIGILSVLG